MLQPNPFIITADYYGPEYFCDREIETKTLERVSSSVPAPAIANLILSANNS